MTFNICIFEENYFCDDFDPLECLKISRCKNVRKLRRVKIETVKVTSQLQVDSVDFIKHTSMN